jgi:hypothetical protein
LFADDATEIIRGRVQGYSRAGSGWRTAPLNAETVGGTGVITTVEELLTWLRNYGHPRVGDATLVGMITAPARLPVGGDPYNFGVRIRDVSGHRAIVLGGEAEAFRTTGYYFPDADLAVVVMANNLARLTAGQLARRVAEIYLGTSAPAPAATSADPAPFSLDAKTARDMTQERLARRAPMSKGAIDQILGEYRIDELDVTYSLQLENDVIVARTLWSVDARQPRRSEWSLWSPIAVTLLPLAPDRLESNSFALGVLKPRSNARGKVEALEIISGSLQGMRLRKVRADGG